MRGRLATRPGPGLRGTLRMAPAAWILVDRAVRVLAVLALLHVAAGALGTGYDPRWLAAPGSPIGWRLLLVLAALFGTAMLVVRPRVRGGVVLARAAAVPLATALLVDALSRFRLGAADRAAPGGPLPLTLLLAGLLYLWVVARRAPAPPPTGDPQERLWHKMLERAHP